MNTVIPSNTEQNDASSVHPKQVMAGMRPTGKLHIGHYRGVLLNWVDIQTQYPSFFMVADWHALTTYYESAANVPQNCYEVVLDWLACGVDPDKSTVYLQSDIPEIAQISLLFSMFTPKKWCEMDPTLKDMVHDELNMGLLGYPVLQTADILSMMGSLVPVGKDQLAHLEISRDIAKRFNHLYQTPLFPEPQALLNDVPMLNGLDGRKMSKSYGNTIVLSETADETWKTIKTAVTDANRVKKTDPGDPMRCQAVFPYYQAFASAEDVALTDKECRNAERGCMECKKRLADILNAQLAPIRERRETLAEEPEAVHKILTQGADRARAVASDTLHNMHQAMGFKMASR